MNATRKSTHTAKIYQYPSPVATQLPKDEHLSLDMWPPLPVFSDTRVVVELMLKENTIDLLTISEVLLTDLGATVQLLRLAGKNCEDSKLHPMPIHECLVSLDKAEILEACSALSVGVKRGSPSSYSELCRHSWLVSRFAHCIAMFVPGAEPDKARLAGLLHDLGRVPSALGWTTSNWPISPEEFGCSLVDQWGLPWYVIYGIRCYDRHDSSAAVISKIVAAAHDCERIYSDGVFSSEPERYEDYWVAVLERAFPDMSVSEQQRVVREFMELSERFPGCVLR